MYKKVNTDLNFVEREHNTLKFWQDNQIFEKSVKGTSAMFLQESSRTWCRVTAR